MQKLGFINPWLEIIHYPSLKKNATTLEAWKEDPPNQKDGCN
jgi:hypothetical protein